jgi:phosphate transport system substrate-binding protein
LNHYSNHELLSAGSTELCLLPHKPRLFDTNLSQSGATFGCVSSKQVVGENFVEPESGAEMLKFKSLVAAVGMTLVAATAMAADITGAGATFPFPVYAKWAEAYKAATGTGMNYQSIGSSGGIRQIRAKTVTFGATDAPVSGADLDKDGMVQFPMIIGGTVPVINLDGFKPGELRVTGPVMAEMFMGKISKWNDAKLVALNPGKKLPNEIITVVHRADGSGTTFNWTDYLTAISKDWADTVGKGAAVKWPAPTSVGGKGNEGVAANVNRIKGSIGYVEYAYVKKNNMNFMQIQNANGKYVSPDDATFAAAAAGADWFSVPGMGVSMVNAKGDNSWPISTASFILMYKNPADKAASAEALKFFDWSFKNGKKMAADLDYVPLPDSLTDQIRTRVWSQIQK